MFWLTFFPHTLNYLQPQQSQPRWAKPH